ncbi:RHS repeat-associated core domain-containing protein [Isoptericola sediminis]|uniref:RHS repeat-associated protein n=1 Tax=Isoptericola sediminis TaxID=2733572 RepID=A0A849K4Z5_9MICO|nr:RHS repeat-associated core domain-containing protein [Isoptericola sediminis]NNU28428.1 hypothetical protein [Isoptericola sediminis]
MGSRGRWLGLGLCLVLVGTGLPAAAQPGEDDGPSLAEREGWTLAERAAYGEELWGDPDKVDPVTSTDADPVPLTDQADVEGTTEWATAHAAEVLAGKDIAGGRADVAVPGKGSAKAQAGGVPIQVRAKDKVARSAAPDLVVETASSDQARAAGVHLLVGAQAQGKREAGKPNHGGRVELTVDAAALGDMGGDFWQRARVVELPACALQTPAKPECSTQTVVEDAVVDAESRTFTATVDLETSDEPVVTEQEPLTLFSSDQQSLSLSSSTTTTMTVMALSAGPSGSSGDWAATPLSPSASWDVSTQSGSFSWSYPLRVPSTPGGLQPDLALSYDSGSLDGRVASTNNQSGPVGDGWSLTGGGYVERKYASCSEDTDPVDGKEPNNASHETGDLCWFDDNATLVLNGQANELIRDGSSGTWRLESDDNTKVEKLTGGWNGDNDKEYWKVTTSDGTQYWFGRGKRSSTDGKAYSDWTVPVYGNHPGEPCYNTSFASSKCTQIWRWNLDYVVDTSGNSMTLQYQREWNRYGYNNNAGTQSYVSGGVLSRIDFGTRTGSDVGGTVPARVWVTRSERCLDSTGCDWASAPDNPSKWPDVPTDLVCDSTTSCPDVTSPAFFSHRRISKITTQLRTSSGAWRDVDRWDLTHTQPDPGDGSNATLWLDKVQHLGVGSGTTVTLPATTFTGVQMANRVDSRDDGRLAMNRYRMSSIQSESGSVTSISYTGTGDCTPTSVPSEPATNDQRCMPVWWSPEGATEPELEYFHKYLVTAVTENAQDGTSDPVVSTYSYVGSPAWHYDDNPLVPKKRRTWGQWRGYQTVDVRAGDPEAPGQPQTRTRYRYFRGMDGDRTASGGSKSVTVDGITDRDQFAGMLRESIVYDGSDVVERTKNVPWRSPATATDADGEKAFHVGIKQTTTETTLASGGVRTSEVTTEFDDTYGMPVSVSDTGDAATAADDVCTRTWYARNTAKNILEPVQRTETVSVKCSATPSRPADVVSDQRFAYDGQAVGAAPTKARMTRQEEVDRYASGSPVYQTVSKLGYDTFGRVTSSEDALGRKSTTAYTDTEGLTTKVTTTSPDPDGSGSLSAHVTAAEVDPAWGTPTKVTDAAGKVATGTYDALGRLTQVWLPGRTQGTDTPTMKYAYAVRSNGQNAVTTSVLNHDASAYQTSTVLYDGMLRQRQTQSPSADKNNPGRIVTDVFYDSRGLVEVTNRPWFTTGSPSTTPVTTTSTVPGSTVTEYDGAGRAVSEIFRVHEVEEWRTETTYGGDRVTVDPPSGGTATTTFVDVRGNTTTLREFLGHNPTGSSQDTTYDYDAGGRMVGVTDPAGNDWTYTYDLRGRQTASSDPDKGTTSSTYDAAGQLVTTTDARGETLAYTYDNLGRQTTMRDDSPTGAVRARWVYDTLVKGQLTRSERIADGETYTVAVTDYDDGYRPLGQTVTVPDGHGNLSGSYTTDYSYTDDGRIEQILFPAAGNLPAEEVNTFYDEANQAHRMGTVFKPYNAPFGAVVAGSDHSPYGELLRADLGSNYSVMWHQQFAEGTRRLETSWVQRGGQSGYDYDAAYSYDDAGNVLKVADTPDGSTSDVQCFAYDGLRRMTEAWTPSSGDCATARSATALGGAAKYWNSYSFDAVGNRTELVERGSGTTTSTYNYPAAGSARPHAVTQVTATGTDAGTSSYAYDEAGNMTTRDAAGRAAQTLTWDPEGELSTVKEGSTTVGEYVYTADGERLLRTEGGTTTLYLPGGQEVTLAGSSMTAKRYYSFEGNTVGVRTAGGPSGMTTIVSDHHGTGAVQVDQSSSTMVRRYTTPFGEDRGPQASWTGDHGFLDKPTDSTGLVAIGARYYDPELGKFISVDPVMDLSDPQQWAAYTYGNNNPVTWADPTGELPMGAGHTGYNPRTDKKGGDPCSKANSCVKREERKGKIVRVRYNYTARAVQYFTSRPTRSYADVQVNATYKKHNERAKARERGKNRRSEEKESPKDFLGDVNEWIKSDEVKDGLVVAAKVAGVAAMGACILATAGVCGAVGVAAVVVGATSNAVQAYRGDQSWVTAARKTSTDAVLNRIPGVRTIRRADILRMGRHSGLAGFARRTSDLNAEFSLSLNAAFRFRPDQTAVRLTGQGFAGLNALNGWIS